MAPPRRQRQAHREPQGGQTGRKHRIQPHGGGGRFRRRRRGTDITEVVPASAEKTRSRLSVPSSSSSSSSCAACAACAVGISSPTKRSRWRGGRARGGTEQMETPETESYHLEKRHSRGRLFPASFDGGTLFFLGYCRRFFGHLHLRRAGCGDGAGKYRERNSASPGGVDAERRVGGGELRAHGGPRASGRAEDRGPAAAAAGGRGEGARLGSACCICCPLAPPPLSLSLGILFHPRAGLRL